MCFQSNTGSFVKPKISIICHIQLEIGTICFPNPMKFDHVVEKYFSYVFSILCYTAQCWSSLSPAYHLWVFSAQIWFVLRVMEAQPGQSHQRCNQDDNGLVVSQLLILYWSPGDALLLQNRRLARLWLGVEVPALPAGLLPRLLGVQVLVWVRT